MAQQYASPADVTNDDKLWALLAYVIPVIVPIIILIMEDKKNRPFLKAHTMQALIWGIAYSLIGGVTSALFIGLCILPVCWIISIYWGVQAYQGKYVTIPLLTDFVKKQGWA
jgi:uncharacterized membrane protein